MQQLLLALASIAIGLFGCVAYVLVANLALAAIFPARGAGAGRNIRRANAIRPWLFLGPALTLLGLYLIYPVFVSAWLSLRDATGARFVGLDNYAWALRDGKFRESMANTFLWLLVVPAASTLLGLVAAGLTDRIRRGALARALIFMPMAMSFVGAAVIWKFVYDYRGGGQAQVGLLNAMVEALGGQPQIWLALPFWNTFFLMAVLVWIQTGFAMVILSAALRGIPEETIEAAILDGASSWQVFTRISVPQIWGTITVVWTTITILVLKVFDIVLVMTNGQWGSQVLANLMFDWMFRGNDSGRASAIAVVIMLLVTPVMIWNIRALRAGGR